tara:strand:- start:38186 stop:40219 length:2034 start_codon:yes stop_codon:yes gene_type:complete
MMLFVAALCFSFLTSCSKDTDLFYDYVLAEEEVLAEENGDNNETSTPADTNNDQNSDNTPVAGSDFVESKPNNIVGTFRPSSAAEITDPARANHKAIIETSFDCNNCTFAENLTIEPAGGAINGTNIELNGAYITNNYKQAFSVNTTFTNIYTKTRLSPETFGGISNDNNPDDAAFSALISQVAYAIGHRNGVYIKNDETIHDRNGIFDWDMNNCTVKTTNAGSLAHGSAVNNQNTYLFDFRTMEVRLFNGEFDGNDLASRAIKLYNVSRFVYDNLKVHNYLSPANAYARGVGLKFDLWGSNFKGGTITNCTIENIGATSDGNANNTPFGVSKAFYFEIYDNGSAAANIYMSGNTVNNIYGDDAEGFLNVKGFGGSYNYQTNNVHWILNNETYTSCQRRAFKVNASNVEITNSTLTTASNAPIFPGAQASIVSIFSITPSQPIKNVNIRNTNFNAVGSSENVILNITDADNCLIENNTFTANNIAIQRSIQFGVFADAGGLYQGDLSNTVIFRNNTSTNIFYLLENLYTPVNGGFVFENNTINLSIDRNLGGHWGAFRIASTSGATNRHTFKNITINVDQTFETGTLFGGVILSQGRHLKNITFDNVNINYTGTSLPTYPFASAGISGTSTNFDSTNMIKNCTMTGAIGTGSINVTGSAEVVIQNSVGKNSNPITIK